jgi:hypothetical protein
LLAMLDNLEFVKHYYWLCTLEPNGVSVHLGSEKLLGMFFPTSIIGISKYLYLYFQSEKMIKKWLKCQNGKGTMVYCEHSCSLKWPSLS